MLYIREARNISVSIPRGNDEREEVFYYEYVNWVIKVSLNVPARIIWILNRVTLSFLLSSFVSQINLSRDKEKSGKIIAKQLLSPKITKGISIRFDSTVREISIEISKARKCVRNSPEILPAYLKFSKRVSRGKKRGKTRGGRRRGRARCPSVC